MGRGKLKMELIKNEKARMITYNKRKKGLIKKVEEFHILCDVDACLIIFGAQLHNQPMEVETWPCDRNQVKRIINRYRSQSGERKRVQNLWHYYEARKKKVDDDIAKIHKACIKAKFPTWNPRLDLFQLHQLRALDCTLQSKLEVAMARVLHIKGEIDNSFNNNIIKSNPISTTFANALQHKQESSFSCLDTFDHHQMLPFNVSPVNSPMLMMMMMANDEDLSLFGCGSDYSNYSKREAWQSVGNLDKGSQNQMVINNPMADSVSYCDVSSQDPLMMTMMMPNNVSSHICNAQFSNMSAAKEFQIGEDEGSFRH